MPVVQGRAYCADFLGQPLHGAFETVKLHKNTKINEVKSMMRSFLGFGVLMALASCDVQTNSAPTSEPQVIERVTRTGSPQSVADFRVVVRRVEPVAEQVCRQLRPGVNCDFSISIDTRPNQPPNAFQTYNDAGRPLLVMTPALLRQMRNRDEIALSLIHI